MAGDRPVKGAIHTNDFVQVPKRLLELVRQHPFDVHVEAFEKRLVEMTPHGITAVFVHLLGVAEKVKSTGEHFDPHRQLCGGCVETCLDTGAVVLDAAQACFDLGLGESLVHREIEQSLFLAVELFELLSQRAVCVTQVALFVAQRRL
ncbi:hypothetical protein A5780_08705 [Nocardia sp. 852002-20019_SCH5090214]|uniref:hypothetical protein n=1 Tax=Nocardia sp. 852002-20019_SCH5090214 TaxID=1834087 RepID=UPI0007EC0AFF|nr:hypothetical protein [Nocardia sp. 852002-20019_SCH5090214]OBA68220.1 hypothetical protein A5780_08705 [Nocardia sp. 852002-20019_SCH5090214]